MLMDCKKKKIKTSLLLKETIIGNFIVIYRNTTLKDCKKKLKMIITSLLMKQMIIGFMLEQLNTMPMDYRYLLPMEIMPISKEHESEQRF